MDKAFFKIIYGTNQQTITTNSSTVAEFTHNTQEKFIQVTPKQEGGLSLTATDYGLEEEQFANATLLVSDVL